MSNQNLPAESSPPRAEWTLSPLYVIADVDACARRGWDPAAFCRAILDGGASLIQLRAKSLAGGAFLRLVDEVVAMTAPAGAMLIINDRADLALAGAAGGVHVGQEDLSVGAVRSLLGPAAVVGLSTHTAAQARAAAAQAVSYVAVGPVFETSTKETGYEAVGLALVEEVRRVVPTALPLVAIGGITLEQAQRVLDAGATSVAVISDLLTDNPVSRVRAYLDRLGPARLL